MASSASVQSILSSSMTGVMHRSSRPNLTLPSTFVPRQKRTVRCMAEEQQTAQEQPNVTPLTNPTPPPQTPPPKPKVSTKFSDVLAFSGPAPERINGRLAMIGFVAAMAVEVAKGEDVAAQLANGGIPWFLGTTVVLSLASLIPLFQGVSVESKSQGFMTSDAEMLNGRFAMLGLVALVFTEFVKGGALV